MTHEEELVSVILPVFNRPIMLREAVESVIAQSYPHYEIIIVDDGSTDATTAVIADMWVQFEPRIKVVSIQNSGPGAAREAGRLLAKGRYIQYLDSDDLLLPDKFCLQINALRANPDCGIAYGKTTAQIVGQPLEYKPLKGTGELRNKLFPALLSQRWWSTTTPLFRREVCDLAGPWLPLVNEEDWEYESRIAKSGVKLVWVDAYVSVTRIHKAHRSSDEGSTDKLKLKHRCIARMSIVRHALEAGFESDQKDFSNFLNGSFLVARQAAMQNVADSRQLVKVVCNVRPGPKIRLYRILTGMVGIKNAAHMSEWINRIIKLGKGRQ